MDHLARAISPVCTPAHSAALITAGLCEECLLADSRVWVEAFMVVAFMVVAFMVEAVMRAADTGNSVLLRGN
jgi:hypothetical protein